MIIYPIGRQSRSPRWEKYHFRLPKGDPELLEGVLDQNYKENDAQTVPLSQLFMIKYFKSDIFFERVYNLSHMVKQNGGFGATIAFYQNEKKKDSLATSWEKEGIKAGTFYHLNIS